MPDLWSLLALSLLFIAVQALIAAAWLALGGLGGQWRTSKSIAELHDEILRVDGRLRREVKTRAGLEGASKARTDAETRSEAAQHLATQSQAPTRVPSALSWINGGNR